MSSQPARPLPSPPPPSPCYSAAGEAAIGRLYDATLSALPFPHEVRRVPTATFGAAHVLVCGPPGAPPLALWHGLACPGPFLLHTTFRPLAERFRVYCADIPGQPGGRSDPAALDPAAHDYGRWAAEVLQALGLLPDGKGSSGGGGGGADMDAGAAGAAANPASPALAGAGASASAAAAAAAGSGGRDSGSAQGQPPLHVGISFGGALLLDLAIVQPEAIRGAALVVPGSLHPDSGRNWLSPRLMLLFLLHGLLHSDWSGGLVGRAMLTQLCDEPDSQDPAVAVMRLAFRHCRTFPEPPGWRQKYTDEQLQRLAAPLLLVAAELDVFGPGRGTAERARAVWPGDRCEVLLLEGGRHASSAARMERVNARIIRFFQDRGLVGTAAAGRHDGTA